MTRPRWLPEQLSPRAAVRDALAVWRARGPSLRRAAILCDLAAVLVTARPRGWRPRAQRAYDGAARRLERSAPAGGASADAVMATATLPPASVNDPIDLALQRAAVRAHRLMSAARRPYRRLVLNALVVVAAGVLALSAVALLGAAVLPPVRHRLFPRDLAERAVWSASTAFPGTPASGIGPSSRTMPYFVHTASEAHPWVEIHLPRPARIREVRVQNRSDCCAERAMPLDVEVPDGMGGWDLICQRHARFASWTCHPWHPVRAQTIRLSLPSSGMLHLRKVSVYE